MLKLDQISLNEGNGYIKYTGVFTVPVSGVYLLTNSIETEAVGHFLEVELVVDNKNMGTIIVDNYTVSRKTIITRLIARQSVWLETYCIAMQMLVLKVATSTNLQLSLEYICIN